MKAERSEEAAEEKFQARRNWSMKLRERTHLHNIKAQGEATSTDLEGAASYPEHLAKVINKGGFTIQQISRQAKQHLEEDVIWMFVATEEKSMPGFKVSRDRLTLFIGANAVDDLKLKPEIIYQF